MGRSVRAGDTFNLTKGPVTTVQLVMYAGASGDFNRIHYDLPFALEAGLGGVIAHGMLTMGFAAQAVTDWAGPGALIRDIAARFLTPVRPGDVVRLTGKVDSTAMDAGRTVASLSFVGDTDNGRVITGSAVAVLAP